MDSAKGSKYNIWREYVKSQDPVNDLLESRKDLETKPMRILRPQKGMSEDVKQMQTYLRDYLISMIDIALDKDLIDFFEINMKITLQMIFEVIDIREIRE